MSDILMKMIPVVQLEEHPDNPRKNLGDITELAESIRKNGLMQNLTVIPFGEGKYRVLIGHRRLAAAKEAGVARLLCKIVELSPAQQVSLMLEENMQRNDLTVYEQAKGFQMLIDLGETEASISEKTGFSRGTVRHRLEMAKLDEEALKKASESESFQLTLSSIYALEKVEDLEKRNQILRNSINSQDLFRRANEECRRVNAANRIREMIDILDSLGIEKGTDKDRYSNAYDWVGTMNFYNGADVESTQKVLDIVKKAVADGKSLIYIASTYDICLREKVEKKVAEKRVLQPYEVAVRDITRDCNLEYANINTCILGVLQGTIPAPKKELIPLLIRRMWDFSISLNYGNGFPLSSFKMWKYMDSIGYKTEYNEERVITNLPSMDMQMLCLLVYNLKNHFSSCVDCSGYYYGSNAKACGEFLEILANYGYHPSDTFLGILDGTDSRFMQREKPREAITA